MTVNFVSLVCVCLLMCRSIYGNVWNQHHKVICLVNCTEFRTNPEVRKVVI